jgi:hypothetical protein
MRELVTHAERHLGVVELVDRIVELRPNAFWRDQLRQVTIEATQSTQEIPVMRIYATATGRLRKVGQAEMIEALINIQDRLGAIEKGVTVNRAIITALSAVVAMVIISILIIALYLL